MDTTIINNISNVDSFIKDSILIIQNQIELDLVQQPNNSQFWGIPLEIANILIPTVVTILIFVLGVLINWIISQFRKRKKLDTYRKILVKWIELLKNPLYAQANDLEEFSKKTKDNTTIQPEKCEVHLNQSDITKEIGFYNLLDTLIINTKGDVVANSKNAYNILATMRYLQNITIEIREKFDSHVERVNSLMEKWNSEFREFDIMKAQFTNTVMGAEKHVLKGFIIDFNNFSNKWVFEQREQLHNASNENEQKIVNINILTTEDNLLKPLLNLCVENLQKFPNEEIVYDMTRKLGDLLITIRMWKAEKIGASNAFSDISVSIKDTYDQLYNISLEIMDSKLKNIWKIK